VAEYVSGQTTIVDHLKYDPFGNFTQSNAAAEPHFTLTGREYDKEIGLYYMRERWYDPKTGRFISTDPIRGAMVDENLYPYCGNDPVNYVDPFGCEAMTFPLITNPSEADDYMGTAPPTSTPVPWPTPMNPINPIGGPSLDTPITLDNINEVISETDPAGGWDKDKKSGLPIFGKPNGSDHIDGPDGQIRDYNEEGGPKKDNDFGHPEHHPELNIPPGGFHVHDWLPLDGIPKDDWWKQRGRARLPYPNETHPVNSKILEEPPVWYHFVSGPATLIIINPAWWPSLSALAPIFNNPNASKAGEVLK
jgi:RHS repeat-associated protein